MKQFIINNLIRLAAVIFLICYTPFALLSLLRIFCRDYIMWLRVEWESVQKYLKAGK